VVFNQGIISKFQVIQNDYEKITIKYVLQKKNEFTEIKKRINQAIRKVMGESCQIIWEEVDSIPFLPSGKYLYVYSEL
jgi:phenylacetate-coenzyme A ligase PaaK-like adenylate-forming protein